MTSCDYDKKTRFNILLQYNDNSTINTSRINTFVLIINQQNIESDDISSNVNKQPFLYHVISYTLYDYL